MPISMSAIWDESAAIIKRERHLMVPLALATVGLGAAIGGVAMPESRPVSLTALAGFGLLFGNLLGLIGNLALAALVLKPGISVSESLRLAIARLPTMIGIVLVLLAALLLILLPVVTVLVASGVKSGTSLESLPPLMLFVGLVGFIAIFYIGIRLTTLNALVVDRDPRIIAAIRDSFAQTKGVFAKILGVFLLFAMVSLTASAAVTATFGLVFQIIGNAAGTPLLGKALTMLTVGMVDALFSVIFVAFVATLYHKLSDE